jgi:16S rRNA (guanine527-N7)-methyltransferase
MLETLPGVEQWQRSLGWQPNAPQQQQFQALYEALLLANQQVNLTRITGVEDFWEKHLWDSLRGVRSLLSAAAQADRDRPFSAIDIGTGAGFPGLPMAIAQPHWHLTLLDSTRKKMAAVDQIVAQLGLENVRLWCDRVEALGQQPQHRATYDLAVIRAVASASACAEYALPLVKLGGCAILYRGQWSDAETAALAPVAEQLGAHIEAIDPFTTPLTGAERTCLHLRKGAPTPAEFPRAIGIPTQKPLSVVE